MYIGLLSKRMSGVSPDIVDRSHKDFVPLVHVVLRHAVRTVVMLRSIQCSMRFACWHFAERHRGWGKITHFYLIMYIRGKVCRTHCVKETGQPDVPICRIIWLRRCLIE